MFIKLTGDVPVFEKAFFRNFVAIFVSAAIMLKNGVKPTFPKGAGINVFLRAASGTLGLCCNFYAVDHLVISDASMLNKLSPFFAIIFSIFLLKEKVKFYQAACVITAFLGAVLILQPGMGSLISFPALIGMIGGAGAGFAYTNVRAATKKGTNGSVIVFYFSVFSTIAVIPLFINELVMPTPIQLLCLILTGVAATGGQLGITAAYSLAPAAEISVYDYSQIVFAAILGVLFLGEFPNGLSIAGYVVIIGAGVVMFLLNNKKNEK